MAPVQKQNPQSPNNDKLDEILDRQEEMSRVQQKLNMDMELILMLLRGNVLDSRDKGLIGQVDENTDEIKKLKNFKDKGIWVSIGATLAGGWGFIDVIRRLTHKQ